jgi:PAS domain S-box-containing protein
MNQHDELGALAATFNRMTSAVAEREERLRENEERFRAMTESAVDAVVTAGSNGTIVSWNRGAQTIFGYGPNEVLGTTLDRLIPERYRQTPPGGLRALASTDGTSVTPGPIELHGLRRDGREFPIELSLATWKTRHGTFLTAIIRDVTERTQLEAQFRQAQKMESVGRLAGGVAHDFNNLLMVISGNLELVDDRAANRNGVREFAVAARKAADRGARLTAQLLAFSRRQTLNPKPVHAGTLIRDFQELIQRAVGEGCEVRLVAKDRLWLCHADPAQLETSLLNLALNARDAMPTGGILEIDVRNVTLTNDAIAGVAAGPYVRLSVRDTGCGIAPEILDRVFEPFFTTKEIGRGTGLGLSMVYGFVRQSGGHVAIESTVGVGTTISLYLPKSIQTTAAAADVVQIRNAPEGSERILMVEDDDDVLDVTSELLRQLGYQVQCARNGTEAIQMLKAGNRFDLLFSDVVMPRGINGVELAREAKRLCSGIKVLLTSGNAADVLARHGAEDEFPIIAKPYRRADLAEYLRLVMREA